MSFFNLIRKRVCWLLCLALLGVHPMAAGPGLVTLAIATLTKGIPLGPPRALTGSQFAASVAKMDPRQREQAILHEIISGNLPGFLRNLIPVKLSYQAPHGKTVTATIFAMPEYLAIGTDKDFLRIPMNLYTAAAAARKLGFVLPTKKIVDAIYAQAAVHFSPEPMAAGPQMRSTEYYVTHNQKVEAQARILGVTPGELVSGDKKDVVVTNRLERNPGRIAIYGWHRLNGAPIQPLSTVHGACYADYSHGIRLVSETVLVDGQARSVYDVLQDPALAGVLSDEGPIPNLRNVLASDATQSCGPAPVDPAAGIPRLPL